MRFLSLVLLATTAYAQNGPSGVPRIDLIEFYGLKRVSVNLVRQALALKEGDLLPTSKEAAEDRLFDIDRVVNARLQAICCDDNKTVLYVGIEEYGGPMYAVRPPPAGPAVLSEQLLTAGQGDSAYDVGSARRTQLTALVDANLPLLREVLRDSGEEFHRSAAAYLLPFATRRAEIVDDLQAALTDNDVEVRARAVRALVWLADRGRADPASKIRVQPEWFAPLITSIAYSDRQEAIAALGALTQSGDRAVLNQLRGDTLDALIEMSRWQTRAHAYPSFLLIGRVAGLRDAEIRDAWNRAGRETVIKQALAKAK
jgi:hypothetical protein